MTFYKQFAIKTLSIVKSYKYDSWNQIENGQVKFDVYLSNEHLGFVDFKTTGQICLIDVKEKYRRKGIANFMLLNVEQELLNNNVTKVWLVCSRDTFDNRPHTSVTGSGYSKKI